MVSHLSFLRSLNWYRGLPTLGQIQFELSDRVWRLFTYRSRIRQNSPESFRPHGCCLKKKARRGCLAVQGITGSWGRELPSLGVKRVGVMLGFLALLSCPSLPRLQGSPLSPLSSPFFHLLLLLFSLSSSPLLLSLLFLSLLSSPSLSLPLPPLPSPFLSLTLLPVFPSQHVEHLRMSLALSQN